MDFNPKEEDSGIQPVVDPNDGGGEITIRLPRVSQLYFIDGSAMRYVHLHPSTHPKEVFDFLMIGDLRSKAIVSMSDEDTLVDLGYSPFLDVKEPVNSL